jgi:hypothetical protein
MCGVTRTGSQGFQGSPPISKENSQLRRKLSSWVQQTLLVGIAISQSRLYYKCSSYTINEMKRGCLKRLRVFALQLPPKRLSDVSSDQFS